MLNLFLKKDFDFGAENYYLIIKEAMKMDLKVRLYLERAEHEIRLAKAMFNLSAMKK